MRALTGEWLGQKGCRFNPEVEGVAERPAIGRWPGRRSGADTVI